jgi:nitroreductase
MTEFAEVVRNRRMTRAFDPTPVDPAAIDDMVDLASRAPSAGKAQGWHLVVLEGDDTAVFWDTTLPTVRRDSFRWQQLLSAPVIALPFADSKAYTDRYAEPDKIQTGLGAGPDAWPVPYWTVDASMSVMTLLLAAEDVGLGALFFGVFRGERELRQALSVPPGLELLGALAIGHPSTRSGDDTDPGRSADRRRRQPGEIIHRGRW